MLFCTEPQKSFLVRCTHSQCHMSVKPKRKKKWCHQIDIWVNFKRAFYCLYVLVGKNSSEKQQVSMKRIKEIFPNIEVWTSNIFEYAYSTRHKKARLTRDSNIFRLDPSLSPRTSKKVRTSIFEHCSTYHYFGVI